MVLHLMHVKREQVIALVEEIEANIGEIDVLVFNIGANVPCSILEETARKYFKIWEMACFGAFLTGREVAKRMVMREHGSIIFTGATAGIRGAANFAAFAGAKHALRALAQSMARELGPKIFMWHTWWWMGQLIPILLKTLFLKCTRAKNRMAY